MGGTGSGRQKAPPLGSKKAQQAAKAHIAAVRSAQPAKPASQATSFAESVLAAAGSAAGKVQGRLRGFLVQPPSAHDTTGASRPANRRPVPAQQEGVGPLLQAVDDAHPAVFAGGPPPALKKCPDEKATLSTLVKFEQGWREDVISALPKVRSEKRPFVALFRLEGSAPGRIGR